MSWSSGLFNALESGEMDAVLTRMYGKESLFTQRQRYMGLLRRMEAWSGCVNGVLITAPGRTELGGNHTDHNNGVVLAAAVHYDCLAVAAASDSGYIRIRSEGFPEIIEVDLGDSSPRVEEEGTSAALVRGVVHGFREQGYSVDSFDACLASDVPVGAGLSSSAAFEVCIGRILSQLFNGGTISDVELARIGRRAENVHFGKPCGFMDQLACAVQGVLSIDFSNQNAPEVHEIECDFADSGYRLVVVDTAGSHADLTPEYAAIPDEMFRAARVLGRGAARGLTVAQVLDAAPLIRREAGDRAVLRLLHFIEESDRAGEQADALAASDMKRFLRLVNASGDSSWRLLQNCVSTTNFLDQPIPLALALTERFLHGDGAWRIQGGGFAGTIQAYVPEDRLPEYRTFMQGLFGPGAVLPLMIRRPGWDRPASRMGEAE
ncbi:galactokinase family protein [uncultured Pseudodesulfovibrio sp.]|uniref:galactokinase n=1 Tax=uncultured Pseudodesulfovibrio sp. TaxID=2035858 RepID=UPI0029C6C741|nr:galactokinase family protein [uncultured Pseudodesulfovibrio sp.]